MTTVPQTSSENRKSCLGCLGVILLLACIFYIFKGPTEKDQEWGRSVKSRVPSDWVVIGERDSRVTLNSPSTWGDKGVGQIQYLLSAEQINGDGDWLVQTAYVRREYYELNPGIKTDLGYVSKETSIYNFKKMEAIYALNRFPKYANVDRFSRSQALNIVREERFGDVYKEGAKEIKAAIERRKK